MHSCALNAIKLPLRMLRNKRQTLHRSKSVCSLPANSARMTCRNRQVTETCDSTGPNNRTKYIYDGNGQRVQKAVGGGLTTTYVYGAAGDLTSEFVSGTPPSNPCTTCYIVSDTLGSTRLMMAASSGSIVALHDYLPFGEEISGSSTAGLTIQGRSSPARSGTLRRASIFSERGTTAARRGDLPVQIQR